MKDTKGAMAGSEYTERVNREDAKGAKVGRDLLALFGG